MEDNSMLKKGWVHRLTLFLLFLMCGLLVFFISITYSPKIPDNIETICRISLMIVFLAVAIWSHRNELLKKYWPVFFAFFVASFALFLSWQSAGWVLHFLDLTVNTPDGIAVAKLSESLLIVIPIILLTRISGDDLALIYLKKGELRLGLIIGLASFVLFAALAVLQVIGQDISWEKVIPLTPWILVFVLANGFMEELLFRGLFLRKYEPFLGNKLSNLLTAVVFTLAHIQVTYTPELPIFLMITFLLALAWGYVMQKTDSIWGSALFHAGVDMLIIIGIFANYGIKM